LFCGNLYRSKFDRRDRGLPYIMRGPTRPLVLLLILSVSRQVLAVDKELIQLQAGVHTLQDQIAKAQTSLNETMGLMTDLLKRNAEQIPGLQRKLDAMKAQLHPDAFSDDQARKMTSDIGELTVLLKDFTIRAEKIEASASPATLPAVSQSAPAVSQSAPQPREKMATIPSPAPANMPVVPQAAPQPAEKSGTLKPQEPSSAQPSAGSPQASPVPAPMTGDGLYERAMEHYTSKDYEIAANEFAKFLNSNGDSPNAANAHFYLAEIEFEQKDYEGALQDYTTVATRLPDKAKAATAQYKKALCLLELERQDEALQELQNVIQQYPNSPEANRAARKLIELGVNRK
jgi:tol-pal system protein YbgF